MLFCVKNIGTSDLPVMLP